MRFIDGLRFYKFSGYKKNRGIYRNVTLVRDKFGLRLSFLERGMQLFEKYKP